MGSSWKADITVFMFEGFYMGEWEIKLGIKHKANQQQQLAWLLSGDSSLVHCLKRSECSWIYFLSLWNTSAMVCSWFYYENHSKQIFESRNRWLLVLEVQCKSAHAWAIDFFDQLIWIVSWTGTEVYKVTYCKEKRTLLENTRIQEYPVQLLSGRLQTSSYNA